MSLLAKAKEQWTQYRPLIVIVLFCALLPITQKHLSATPSMSIMYGFMGYFLVFLSMFKFFDLKGFVKGFSMYDVITKKFPAYGYIYPFIELLLGIAYLSQFHVIITSILTIIVMSAGAVGVFKSIAAGEKFTCACLGTVLNVPLSTVSILENVGMVVMAIVQLIR